ncbi:MAG: ribosome biogenesis GTPase Der, partial [Deltaproteobacteria bacterium]
MKELVAIVGRPNVGKSTLLNRLAGRQVALVADTPGVTRDRIYAGGDLAGREVILVDTGGFDPRPGDSIEQAVVEQAKAAVAEADLILLVADARDGLNPLDSAIADLLRRSSRPVLLLANKVDPGAAGRDWQELQGLGFPTYPISAAHGSGLDEVETRARSILEQNHPAAGETAAEEQAGEEDFRLCLLGRPNVGKSSLANRLLGRQRQIVSDTPGTTRDAVDIVLCRDGISCLLVDTPGVRRRRSVKRQLEQASVLAALRSLERAHVAAVMLDAGEEIGSQD